MVFFWLKRLFHRDKAVGKCPNCKKQFFRFQKGSLDYYYLNRFTGNYEAFRLCSGFCYDEFYAFYRETPHMELQRKIRDLTIEYIYNGFV